MKSSKILGFDAYGNDVRTENDIPTKLSDLSDGSRVGTLESQIESQHDEITEINQKIPSEASSHNQLADKRYVDDWLSYCEIKGNKTQIIDEYSTDEQYPSAEAVYNALQNITVNSINEYEVQDIVTEEMYDTYYNINIGVSYGSYEGNSVIGDTGTAKIVIVPDRDNQYFPPQSVTVTNANYSYDSTTGIITLSQPTGDVNIIADCEQGYLIVMDVIGGTYSSSNAHIYNGEYFIYTNGVANITITPNIGYDLPSSIILEGSDYSYDSTTGVIDLFDPYSGIFILVECESNEKPYLTFESDGSFTLSIIDNIKYWDGVVEYNRTDPAQPSDWIVWDGTSAISSGTDYNTNKEVLFVRGSNNTYITGSSASNNRAKWVLTPSSTDLIDCNGNIENLLDYQMVANGQHPPMADHCFSRLFQANSYLRRCPAFRATTLNTWCYHNALRECPELITLPALPALDMVNMCYYYMFYNDSKIKLSETQDSTYVNEYRIPTTGIGTGSGSGGMFDRTGGSFTGTPSVNTTYYTANEIIE